MIPERLSADDRSLGVRDSHPPGSNFPRTRRSRDAGDTGAMGITMHEDSLPMTDQPRPPSRVRMAAVVWLAIFPLVTVVLGLMPDLLLEAPVIVRSFVLTAIVVPAAVVVVVPRLTRLFSRWLHR